MSINTFKPESLELLPMVHLQLGRRAYSASLEASCGTIADVIAGLHSGRLSTASLGKKTAEEILATVALLQRATTADVVNWEQFWAERGLAEDYIAITTANLERLASEVRDCGLGILHLKKASSGLEMVGIKTVGGLIDAAHAGIGKLKNFGAAARGEVVRALPALSKAISSDGVVDWCLYASLRGFKLVPEAAAGEVRGAAVLELLPELCKTIILEQLDDRAWQIFQSRLLAPEAKGPTLEEIGSLYGVTRERIRQLETDCINAIRKPLFNEDYFGLCFRLRPELRRVFTDARYHYESLGLPAWRESRWFEELATLWHTNSESIVRYDHLLMALLCYRRVRSEQTSIESLIVVDATAKSEADRLMGLTVAVHEILSEQNLGMDTFSLAIALKKRGQDFKGLDEVPVLVELCSSTERVGSDIYRLKFKFLRNREDQALRVLAEHGSPLHYTDLLREINRRSPKQLESKESLVNQICGSERIKPIGKSGQWALAEWGLESRSLIDVMEDVLKEADEAMPKDLIAAKVLEKRPGSILSVAMLLDQYPERFRKVGPQLYALTAWGVSSDEDNYWHNDAVAKFVEMFFSTRKGQVVDFKELREAFSKESGLSSRSARGILSFHPAVEVERPNTYRRLARLRPDWRSFERARNVRKGGPLQVDQIVELACAKLNAASTGALPLSTIVQQIETELGIQRPNIYAAISQSDEIETVAVEGSVLKICRLLGRMEATYPQLATIADVGWRAECERATAKLTLDDVDIGLFILGRQFDHAMRQLLEAARDHAGMPVTEKQIFSVGSRIAWAVSHKVFHDEATLNLLKHERNARGHEPAPIEERRAIMKFAPFLAGLYLDYLVIIEKKIQTFRPTQNTPVAIKAAP